MSTPTPAPPSSAPAGRAGPRRPPAGRNGALDRRTVILSAVILAVAIVGGTAVVAALVDDGPRQDTQGQLTEQGGAKPHIIPRPGEGQAPSAPNERGGSEQLALFGLVLAAMAGIGVVIFRGGKTARAGRAEWLAAGRTGHDGVLLAYDELDPDADLTPAAASSDADLR